MTLLEQAVQHHLSGRLSEAERLYRAVLAADSQQSDALHLLGVVAHQVGRDEIAVGLIEQAIAVDPDIATYHSNRGNALRKLGRTETALACYDTALRISPDYVDAHYNRGIALYELGRSRQALAAYHTALALEPNHALALSNRGVVLHDLGRLGEALASFDAALRIKPDHAETFSNRGVVLHDLDRLDEALASYAAVLCLQPDHANALFNRSSVLYALDRLDEAITCCTATLHLRPAHTEAICHLIHCMQSICRWDGLAPRHQEAWRQIPHSNGKIAQFALLTFDGTAGQHLAAAKIHAGRMSRATIALPTAPPHDGAKIRIGYLSADFRTHPVAQLVAELIERHDRNRFAISGYSYGPDDGSAMRRRLMAGFDRFTDLRASTYQDAARIIHRDGIDILVDLTGYTRGARTEILAGRPAPVQVNFLGYPGTMGADFIDYIIADPICIPPGAEASFSESVVRLPDCYQPNDRLRKVAGKTPSREAAGLPPEGFVFCCFNNSFKITPAVFSVWMRLLARVPGSVLWLLDASAAARNNLRQEAAKAGIDPDRLAFAPRQSLPHHLARHRLADLFLDTLPYNAHTTASDALWMGLPVLTCRGETFAGRVAASLLTAIGIPELITSSLGDYEAAAFALATDPALLANVRQQLEANRDTAPLFDTGRFTRNIETAYERMWDRHRAGLAPQGFDLG